MPQQIQSFVPRATIERLKAEGSWVPSTFGLMGSQGLAALCGIPLPDAMGLARIQKGWGNPVPPVQPETTDTGVPFLNAMLGGGLARGMLTGVYGAFATGKSQLAHQLAEWFAAHAVSSPRWVYFFDTENTFRPERIADMAAPREHDQATVLQHIRHIEAANLTQIKALIRRFDNLASEEPPALVVVDSLSNPFRREVGGEQPNLHRLHRDFIQVLEKLEGIARTYAIPVFLTSQVSSKPGSGLTGAPRSVSKPFMNNLWSHFVKASCFLEDAEELVGGPRGPRLLRATLMNHGTQPNQTMDYIIRVSGLEGV